MFINILFIFFIIFTGLCAEVTENEIRAKFSNFAPQISNYKKSVAFLENLNSQFRNELVQEERQKLVEMMEKILYDGLGVGGILTEACNLKEYTIMVESAVIVELWHKLKGELYFQKPIPADAASNKNKKGHYETLKIIRIVVDKIIYADAKKRFFKDVIQEVVAEIPDMTADKLFKVPAMRQIDTLVANLLGCVGFATEEDVYDYADAAIDDGLNPLRGQVRTLMEAESVGPALVAADAIETTLWGFDLASLEAHAKQNLILRAFAAIERIKSIRFDGTYRTKDPRAPEDRFEHIATTADAATKKKNTILLLISMALQEYFFNPLNTRDDLKKIVLAKLQQSNYWGASGLLEGKTDLASFPIELPGYIDDYLVIMLQVVRQTSTIPKSYKSFVVGIEERAKNHKSNEHLVGGNTFLHLASSGQLFQCGFFSFGLMHDDAHNARQKYFDIITNSIEPNTLRSMAKMGSVLESIELFAQDRPEAEQFKLLRALGVKGVDGIRAIGNFYPYAEKLVDYLKKSLDKTDTQNLLNLEDTKYETERTDLATRQRITIKSDGSLGFGDEDPRMIPFQQLNNTRISNKDDICVRALRNALITHQDARTAFSDYAKTVLAAKLLPEETKQVYNVNYSDIQQQLLFRPGESFYQEVLDPGFRATAPSPTATIAEALNINVQVVSTSALFIGNHGQVINHLEPIRAFANGYFGLQYILVHPKAKNQLLINFGGGHYEKLIPLTDTVALARALRHLAWMGKNIPELN